MGLSDKERQRLREKAQKDAAKNEYNDGSNVFRDIVAGIPDKEIEERKYYRDQWRKNKR